ncbi:MAG: protein O-mannosyl-transferase family, partial [Acidobacteriota bacterium]
MKNKLVYRITGAVVFLISFVQFVLTAQPSVSFWDCGEFTAAAYSLQVPHPPGAPFFSIIGRFFSMLPFFGSNVGFR